ncbi:MAG: peptidylprolyl isomerase [Gemmatimonadaceae bacterium]|nr:peptidylprolyl isomerase [Gemmatimonadaceae bacterium]
MRESPVSQLLRLSRLALPAAAAVLACAPAYRPAPLTDPSDARFVTIAPDSFDVRMVTTKGEMLVRVRRHWAPIGADRFYALVRNHYFDSVAFHRTIRGFVAQFGIHGDTAVSRAWRGKSILDDPVKVVNQKGTLSFARGGPNTRSVQLFFNTVDNTPRLDTLNTIGFPPVGQVIQGLPVLDSLNWEYSGTRGGQTFPGPSQDSLSRQGNAYLRRNFPRLDYIITARVVRRWT